MFETCDHRKCAVVKLLTMTKLVSMHHANLEMSEDDIINVGMRALVVLGVRPEEVADAAIEMILSPLVSDIEDDPAMATWDGEHPER
jgi:hypothetical protein